MFGRLQQMVSQGDALAGRDTPVWVPGTHEVLGTPLEGPWPEGHEVAYFSLGCFWGGEKFLWQVPGVYSTAVGYSGGYTPNPTYEEVCTGRTGHAETVLVVHAPAVVDYEQLLKVFWEVHDPTQQMRQGNDVGTQYRSAIFVTSDEQRATAEGSRDAYQRALHDAGYGEITTGIAAAGDWYYAEAYHQQYLHKNPHGYCNHGSCQVAFQTQTGVDAAGS